MRAFCSTPFSARPAPVVHPPRPRRNTFVILQAFLCATVLLGGGALFADGRRTFESPLELPEAQKKLEELLKVVDHGRFYYEKETGGYTWRLENKWYSPFDYTIYGGYISKRQPITLLRVEGAAGDVDTFSRILYEEKFFLKDSMPAEPPGAEPLGNKYHLISQPLNLIAPWLGVFYNGYGSPRLTRGQMWKRFIWYFVFDAFLIYAGGTNWFQQGTWDPQEFGGNIAAGMALVRAVGAYQSMNTIRGHNRIAELKYTFPISD